MSGTNDNSMFDPLEAWRGMRDNSLDAWSKAMIQAVNTEAYAKAAGSMLDAYLTASIPFREMLEKTMAQALQQLNMPTRADLTSLADRLTQIEVRLDDLDTKIERLFAQTPADKPSAKLNRKEAK